MIFRNFFIAVVLGFIVTLGTGFIMETKEVFMGKTATGGLPLPWLELGWTCPPFIGCQLTNLDLIFTNLFLDVMIFTILFFLGLMIIWRR